MDGWAPATYLARVIAFLLVFALLSTPARSEIIGGEESYRACMALARSNPAHGEERALGMIALKGGAPARHCLATALLGLDRYADAADAFVQVAIETRDPQLRVEALGQAGNVWVLAGDLPRAVAAFGEAIRLRRDDPDLFIDRAIALAAAANYFEAIDDLNRAVDLDPRRAEAYVFRATACRYVDAPDLATEDVEAALALRPGFPEALIERGILRRLAGNDAGARADWISVLQRAPGSAAADAARDNLAKLDIKIR
ncbi:MAG: tetratricopeptide repeat protein [Alphaproteobacteria bacterium]|nr:tetratricopeptide repeat protein [Alphaproteobacteria bacterium]